MKTFRYTIEGRELTIRVDEKNATIADFLVDGQHPTVTAEKMPIYAAVISLALIEYDVEVVHDDEPGRITLQASSGDWGSPASFQSRLGTTTL